MKITEITAHALSAPIDPPREHEFRGGTRTIHKRDVVLVVVETADGAVGYAPAGASSSSMREYFAGATHLNFVELIDDVIAPELRGVSVEDPSEIHDRIARINIPEFLQSQLIGALDVALYDILGKERGAPIYELLVERSDIPARPTHELDLYASGGMYMPPEGYVEEAEGLADYGFEGYKYRPGLGPEKDLRTLELLSEAVGDRMEIMVDAHTWWKTREDSYNSEVIEDLVSEFLAYDPYWIEEPVAPDAHEEYRQLREATGAPLAGGESEESPAGLRELGATGAVDYLQGDVRHHRGFTGCWEAVAFCHDRDVTFVPHHFGTQLGLVANAHLVAAAPGSELLEYPVFEKEAHPGMYPFDLEEEILTTPLDPTGGELTVPDGPGLGVDIDHSAIEEYPYAEGPWTEFEYDNPA